MIYLILKSKLQTTKKTINKGSPVEKPQFAWRQFVYCGHDLARYLRLMTFEGHRSNLSNKKQIRLWK